LAASRDSLIKTKSSWA